MKPREEIKKLDIIESSELESSEEENYNLNLGYDKDDKNILATLVKRCKVTNKIVLDQLILPLLFLEVTCIQQLNPKSNDDSIKKTFS